VSSGLSLVLKSKVPLQASPRSQNIDQRSDRYRTTEFTGTDAGEGKYSILPRAAA
jgi:hypothetical protein